MKTFVVTFFFFLVFLLSFFVSGIVESLDGLQYLTVARNIFYGKGPTAIPYEYSTRQNIHMSTYTGRDGRYYSLTGLGFSVAMVPAVALTDLVYKHFSITPPVHFPLESDWVILLFTSFTNIFFTALLGVILFLYFKELELPKRQALSMSLISIFATNLFVYAKHLMPHMMFITFLMLSLYLLRLYSRRKKILLIIFSGLSFGIVMITYNITFYLTFPALGLYYLLITKFKFKFASIKKVIRDIFAFLVGLLPFIAIFIWFENLRANQILSLASPSVAPVYFNYLLKGRSIAIILEGLYGQLFSPGRSIFIYSPLLIMVLLFWHKINRKYIPELVLFLIYLNTLFFFYSVTYAGSGISAMAIWHGESSWGPRYLSATIPMAMLLVGCIYMKISKIAKIIVFFPLCLIGLYVEILGILMPYQIKFHELESEFSLNGTNYTVYLYSNLLPRYNPIFMMSKKLYKLVNIFPKTFKRGVYHVKFYDGIDFPFSVGPERWRAIENTGYISFDNSQISPVNKITFDLINHPISTTKVDARINITLNGNQLTKQPITLKITERKKIELPVEPSVIKLTGNDLKITVDYGKEPIFEKNKQILGLIAMYINNESINLESIDIPYVSPLGPKITGIAYKNWGGTNKDPWKFWDLHTQAFERLPDFWWIRNLYYWDIPKKWIFALLGFNLVGLLFSGSKLISSYKKLK